MLTLRFQICLAKDLQQKAQNKQFTEPHRTAAHTEQYCPKSLFNSIPDIYQAISMSVLGAVGTNDIQMTGLKPLSDAEMNPNEAGLIQSESVIK